MNKKVILGILLTALALAFLMPVYRMLTEGDSEEMPVQFQMEDQQLVPDKKKLRVQIVVNTTDVTNLSLTFNDSLLKEWKSPKGTLFYDFVAGPSGLGTGIFELKAQRQDGQLVTDSRTITVVSDFGGQSQS